MTVPVFAEVVTILLYLIEEQCMEEPEMVRVAAIEGMEPLETRKECPPASGKVPATL